MRAPRAPLTDSAEVTIESSEDVWNGRNGLQLVRFRQRRFDGAMSGLREWEMLRRGPAAAVLPYDPDTEQVLLIEQFRLPALAAGMAPVLVELPAGMCDPGETAEQSARREALEEAHVTLGAMHRLGQFMLSPGCMDETVTIFIGRMSATQDLVLAGGGGLASEQEDIRVSLRPAEAAIADALSGRLTNLITVAALLWLHTGRDSLRKLWA